MLPRIPALLTRASMRPNASQAICTDLSTVGPSAVTSSSTATALRLLGSAVELEEEVARPLISSQRDLSRPTRREAATTRHPARARSRQKSRPKPDEAPVTITTLSGSSHHGSRWSLLWPSMAGFWLSKIERTYKQITTRFRN